MLIELTARRTLALRDALARNPQVAMTALLHKLCLDTFHHGARDACLEASVRQVYFPMQGADLKESAVAKAVAERYEALKADMPRDSAALWDWLGVVNGRGVTFSGYTHLIDQHVSRLFRAHIRSPQRHGSRREVYRSARRWQIGDT